MVGVLRDFNPLVYLNPHKASELRGARIKLVKENDCCSTHVFLDSHQPVARSANGWHHPNCKAIQKAIGNGERL